LADVGDLTFGQHLLQGLFVGFGGRFEAEDELFVVDQAPGQWMGTDSPRNQTGCLIDSLRGESIQIP